MGRVNLERYDPEVQGASAPNTVRMLQADTAAFTAWRHAAGALALPAAPSS